MADKKKENENGKCEFCGSRLSFSRVEKKDGGSIWSSQRWCNKCKRWYPAVKITK